MDDYLCSHGLLVESDTVSLSPWLCVEGNKLIDSTVGVSHRLRPKAFQLVRALVDGSVFGDWRKLAVTQGAADAELAQLISGLNHIGGLQIKRTFRGWKQWFRCLVRTIWFGQLPRPQTVTTIASPTNIAVQTFLAMKWLFILAPTMITLLCGIGYDLGTAIFLVVCGLFCLWVSTLVHEIVHWIILGRQRKEAVFMRRGLRLGMLHKEQSVPRELTSAIAGPLSGVCISLMISLVVLRIGGQSELWFMGLSCALFHALSLLPAYGDGATINKVVRRKYEAWKQDSLVG